MTKDVTKNDTESIKVECSDGYRRRFRKADDLYYFYLNGTNTLVRCMECEIVITITIDGEKEWTWNDILSTLVQHTCKTPSILLTHPWLDNFIVMSQVIVSKKPLPHQKHNSDCPFCKRIIKLRESYHRELEKEIDV